MSEREVIVLAREFSANKKLTLECSFYIPLQVNTSPVQPVLQAHEYDPRLLVHVACSSQLSRSNSHSLISKREIIVLRKVRCSVNQSGPASVF